MSCQRSFPLLLRHNSPEIVGFHQGTRGLVQEDRGLSRSEEERLCGGIAQTTYIEVASLNASSYLSSSIMLLLIHCTDDKEWDTIQTIF